jgi:RNA polymerase sigma-70 factor (ECF subfamily)
MEPVTAAEGTEAIPDTVTFERFFEAERRRLFRALFVMTGSGEEAEEITQDAFLKVWQRWDRVGAMADPVAYLFRTAMNAARSRYRRALRAARLQFLEERSVEPYGAADTRDAVIRAVAALPPRQRQAVVLVELLDRSIDETADLMRISSSTVRSLTSEARMAMRSAMERDDE